MSATAALSHGQRQARWLEAVAGSVRVQILRTLSAVPDASISELCASSQASYQTLRRHLDALQAAGIIRAHPGRSDGETSGRPATRFSLAPDLREEVRAVFGEAG